MVISVQMSDMSHGPRLVFYIEFEVVMAFLLVLIKGFIDKLKHSTLNAETENETGNKPYRHNTCS